MKQFLIYIKSLPLFSFVAVIILGAAISAFSQETTGSIEGTIKDPQGNSCGSACESYRCDSRFYSQYNLQR